MPCGYNLRQAMEVYARTSFPRDWQELPAVAAGRVLVVDASSYFSRPGPRLVIGLKLLAQFLHPDCVAFSLPSAAAQRVPSVV
jgi:iron complex transport system substrate-binding protein